MSGKGLSDHLAEAWELVTYSAAGPYGDYVNHCFLLRRNGEHKVLTIKQKTFGDGFKVSELEV